MDINETALRILCAWSSQDGSAFTPHPRFGEKEIKAAFLLAETFHAVVDERQGDMRLPRVKPLSL